MDKFIKFFTAEDEDDDDVEEYVEIDPVIEARRKEKFSAPLIYDDDDEAKEYKTSSNTTNTTSKSFVLEPKKQKVEKTQVDYQMRDIISPFSGVEQQYDTPKSTITSSQSGDDKPVIPTIKKTKSSSRVTQIVSPFYGVQVTDNEVTDQPKSDQKVVQEEKVVIPPTHIKEELVEEIKPVEQVVQKSSSHLFDDKEINQEEMLERQKELEQQFSTGQITQSIRNLSQMIAEEEQNLKIIEEKTGEFKLELDSKEDSIVDNVEDTMSLDDLMSLYETKFKE